MRTSFLQNIPSDLTTILLTLFVIAILVFLILREYFCWYWKINKRIELMKLQNKYLKALALKMGVSENELKEIEKKHNSWF